MTARRHDNRRKAWLRTAVLACLVATSLVPLRAAEQLDRVLAVVSGTVITMSDARAALVFGFVRPSAEADPVAVALRWLEDRQLVLDELNRYDTSDIDPARVSAAVATIRARFPSEAEFSHALLRTGLDAAGLQRVVRETLRAEDYVSRRFDTLFVATEEELRDYVARHPEQYSKNGRPPAFEDVQVHAREAVQRERRREAVETWLGRLRRRGDISEIYLPVK